MAETLADLAKAGKKLGANPQEINKLARRAQNYINKLSPNDAPTKYLQNAYQKLIDTVQGGAGKEAVNRALGEAMDAKIKYNAERISRTELARAHAEAFHAKYDDDERVTGYKWLLSSRHHITDECTMLAELDNGAGKGVYRKEDFPVQPAHPNCMCMLGVHVGDVPKKTEFRTVRDYLKGLPANERAEIIGKANSAHETLYRRGLEKRGIHFGEEPRRIPEELIEVVPEAPPIEEAPPTPRIEDFKRMNSGDEFKVLSDSQNVTPQEANAIYGKDHGYVATKNYKNINGNLRSDPTHMDDDRPMGDPNDLKTIEILTNVTERNALPEDYIGTRYLTADAVKPVFGIDNGFVTEYRDASGFDYYDRGSTEKTIEDLKALAGQPLPEKGFMSVSMIEDLNMMSDKPVKLTLLMPKGLKGFVTNNLEESEFVAARGTQMRIVDAKIINKKTPRGQEMYYINIIAELLN